MCKFLIEISTLKQAIKLKFRRNEFRKKTVQNLQTSIHFLKKLRDQVDKIKDQFYLSKSILNVSFKFIPCQETCR